MTLALLDRVVQCFDTVLWRTVLRDFSRYNGHEEDEEEEVNDLMLVHDSILRTPQYLIILSISYGSGFETMWMTKILLFFARLVFLSRHKTVG